MNLNKIIALSGLVASISAIAGLKVSKTHRDLEKITKSFANIRDSFDRFHDAVEFDKTDAHMSRATNRVAFEEIVQNFHVTTDPR